MSPIQIISAPFLIKVIIAPYNLYNDEFFRDKKKEAHWASLTY